MPRIGSVTCNGRWRLRCRLAPRRGPQRSEGHADRRAGFDGLSAHDLRHPAASLAIAAGAHVNVVQQMLGHASAAMTRGVYAGLFGDDLNAWRTAPVRLLGGQVRIFADTALRRAGRAAPFEASKIGLTRADSLWGGRGLNPRPEDYECAGPDHNAPLQAAAVRSSTPVGPISPPSRR